MNCGLRHFGNDVMQLSNSRIWRDFGSALPCHTRLTQTKPVIPLSNKHGSQVKDQGRRQCCHNKHKNFPIGLHVMYHYFPDTPLICHTDSCRAGPGWNCSSILVLLEICLQTCMTFTIAECTVNKILMMDRGTARNMQSFMPE